MVKNSRWNVVLCTINNNEIPAQSWVDLPTRNVSNENRIRIRMQSQRKEISLAYSFSNFLLTLINSYLLLFPRQRKNSCEMLANLTDDRPSQRNPLGINKNQAVKSGSSLWTCIYINFCSFSQTCILVPHCYMKYKGVFLMQSLYASIILIFSFFNKKINKTR